MFLVEILEAKMRQHCLSVTFLEVLAGDWQGEALLPDPWTQQQLRALNATFTVQLPAWG